MVDSYDGRRFPTFHLKNRPHLAQFTSCIGNSLYSQGQIKLVSTLGRYCLLSLLKENKQAVSPRSGHEPVLWRKSNTYSGEQMSLELLTHQNNCCKSTSFIMLGFTGKCPTK